AIGCERWQRITSVDMNRKRQRRRYRELVGQATNARRGFVDAVDDQARTLALRGDLRERARCEGDCGQASDEYLFTVGENRVIGVADAHARNQRARAKAKDVVGRVGIVDRLLVTSIDIQLIAGDAAAARYLHVADKADHADGGTDAAARHARQVAGDGFGWAVERIAAVEDQRFARAARHDGQLVVASGADHSNRVCAAGAVVNHRFGLQQVDREGKAAD